MTRTERINKLGRAIITYRGSYNTATGKWINAPQIHKRDTIVKHLVALHRPHMSDAALKARITEDARAIDGFKNRDEYRDWIQAL